MRDQEVTRANRELAAYFKGKRTEREARAALKIIKAFVRDRERQDTKRRAPLPGMAPPPPLKRAPRKRRAKHEDTKLTSVENPKLTSGENAKSSSPEGS